MENNQWRERLAAAINSSGKSKRSISLASGNGPGYVHSILSEGKDPTLDNLLSVCAAIPVSVVYIIHGIEVSPEDTEILKSLRDNPDARSGILAILRSKVAS